MTPERWAQAVSDDLWDRFNRGEPPAKAGEMKRRYAEVIRKAVAEERELIKKELLRVNVTDVEALRQSIKNLSD